MAFQLNQIVPWGRSFDEYCRMFSLTSSLGKLRIIGCGDGPSSFNAEATLKGWNVTSIDPIYQYRTDEIRDRIEQIKDRIMEQTRANQHQFLWDLFSSPDELFRERIAAMDLFLGDYEAGKLEGRYLVNTLPSLTFEAQTFDLALVSHLLFLYSEQLDLNFHLEAIQELLRIAKEVRLFPLLDLTASKSRHLSEVIDHFSPQYDVTIVKVDYEFQRGGNEMMILRQRIS